MSTALVVFAVAYPVVHFLAYALVVRHAKRARTEAGIFLWHAASFTAFSLTMLVATLVRREALPVVMAIALHGFYSITFLMLWSGTEGSYSLSILRAIDASVRTGAALRTDPLRGVGTEKEVRRAKHLLRGGLLTPAGALTGRGRVVAGTFDLLRRATDGTPGMIFAALVLAAGVATIVFAFARTGISVWTFTAVAGVGFASELTFFLVTLVRNSVSAKYLIELRRTGAVEAGEQGADPQAVERRIEGLVRLGLAEQDDASLRLTPRGRFVLALVRFFRTVFGHEDAANE